MPTPSKSTSARIALLLALLIPLWPSIAYAQSDTGVDGDSYTSPTFGYSIEWDEDTWEVDDEFTEEGYDAIVLESDNALLYLEGVYFYQGDPDDCLKGELETLAENADVDELESWDESIDIAIEPNSDDSESGLYAFPEEGEPDEIISAMYLACETLIPESAVLIVTAFVNPDDVEDQLDLVADVLATYTYSPGQDGAYDEDSLEQGIRKVRLDVDAFWADVFDELGDRYDPPKYITFLDEVETGCGDASAGESGPFYCPGDETVYFDLEEMVNFELPYGFIIIQMVVAHEIAHHVQFVRNLSGCQDEICGRNGSSLAIELQADCLSGAWMRDAADRGVVKQRDLKHLEVAIKDYLADPPGTRNNDPQAHGDGDTRFTMFMLGYLRGIEACGFE